jgi:type III secretory pathway lipoprotein EscJ
MRFLWLSILLSVFAACGERIVHDVDEAKANRIVIALSRHGIEAEKVREGGVWSVRVDQHEVTSALQTLDESRLLQVESSGVPEASSSFIQNAEERRMIVGARISSEVEKTLERFPRVLEAYVHLNIHSSQGLLSKPTRDGTASVLIVSEAPETVSVSAIQEIVAGAAGVPAEKIAVVKVASQHKLVPETKTTVPEREVDYKSLAPVFMFVGISVGGILLLACFFKSNKQRGQLRNSLQLEGS